MHCRVLTYVCGVSAHVLRAHALQKLMAARWPARLALKYGSAMRGVSPIVARSALDDVRCSSDFSKMCTAYAYANFCDSDEKSARVLFTCAQASSV